MILRRWLSVDAAPELKELYVFSLVFSLAEAMILIFEPVFFYSIGLPLYAIALYYAVHYSLYVFVLPWGARFAARYGLERSLTISAVLFIFYFLTLALIPEHTGLMALALVLLTVHKIFYWPAYQADLAKHGDGPNRGTELSWMRLCITTVGILGPLIGGVIAARFGFPTLFVITAATALIATFTLLRTPEHYHQHAFDYRSPWRIMSSHRHRRLLLGISAMGENLIDLVFWPIFMVIILGSVAKLGFVVGIATLAVSLFGFVIGELSDRWSPRFLLRLHIPFVSLAYLFRPIATTPIGILLTDTFGRAANTGVQLPLAAHIYGQASRTSVLSYVTAYEMILALAKAATAWILVWVFFVYTPYTAFTITFILSAVLVWLYAFL